MQLICGEDILNFDKVPASVFNQIKQLPDKPDIIHQDVKQKLNDEQNSHEDKPSKELSINDLEDKIPMKFPLARDFV